MSAKSWEFILENKGLIVNAAQRACLYYNYHDLDKDNFIIDMMIEATLIWDNIDEEVEVYFTRRSKKEMPEVVGEEERKSVLYNRVHAIAIWQIQKMKKAQWDLSNVCNVDDYKDILYVAEEDYENIDDIQFITDYMPREIIEEPYYALLTPGEYLKSIRRKFNRWRELELSKYLKGLREVMKDDERVLVGDDGTVRYLGERGDKELKD